MCKVKDDIICIIIDKSHEILYTGIDNRKAIEYLNEVGAIDRLTGTLPLKYNSGNYHVTIDKIVINQDMYYLITAVPGYIICENYDALFFDSVTGLYSRNYWEKIKRERLVVSSEGNLTLLLLDIDKLKKINDTYGHQEGDRSIKIVGQAIRNCIRRSDIAVRYGGDEFIIILPNQDRNAAEKIIKRIRNEIKFLSEEQNIFIDISVGISSNCNTSNIDGMMQIADRDLYHEKNAKMKQEIEIYDLCYLKKEIEKLKKDLKNEIIYKDNKLIINKNILELSKKIDTLINKYMEDLLKNTD